MRIARRALSAASATAVLAAFALHLTALVTPSWIRFPGGPNAQVEIVRNGAGLKLMDLQPQSYGLWATCVLATPRHLEASDRTFSLCTVITDPDCKFSICPPEAASNCVLDYRSARIPATSCVNLMSRRALSLALVIALLFSLVMVSMTSCAPSASMSIGAGFILALSALMTLTLELMWARDKAPGAKFGHSWILALVSFVLSFVASVLSFVVGNKRKSSRAYEIAEWLSDSESDHDQ